MLAFLKKAFTEASRAFRNVLCSYILRKKQNKKYSKLIVYVSRLKAYVITVNGVILKIADLVVMWYNQYIAGRLVYYWRILKNILQHILIYCKNIYNLIITFYKKDKKRAIVYFIILYILYKTIFSLSEKILAQFQTHKNEMVVSVRVVVPERISKNINCYGYIKSENNLQYVSEVRGNIDSIYVQEKQHVYAGQLLMALDSKFTANTYTSAKSILESKKFQYDAIKKLYEDGLESKGNLKAMEADLENANSSFESAKKAYNGLMIRAPFDGYIDNINNKEGAQVNPGTKLFTLERMNAMQVKCDVQNLSINEVNIGDNVRIFINGNEVAVGKISVIGDSIDVGTGSRTIIVNQIAGLPGLEDKVKPGISVMMKVLAHSQKPVYKISSEALETTDTGAFMVKILKPLNGEVYSKNVWIYDEQDGVNYVNGLTDGDYVIERGHEFVNIGEKNIRYIKNDKVESLSFSEKIKQVPIFVKTFVKGCVNFVRDFPEFFEWSKEYYSSLFRQIKMRVTNSGLYEVFFVSNNQRIEHISVNK